ncbi:hypothetical protein [Corallococcus exiguus]|uniref:hypothetical protein n=1 Tax=Corallococcus exiguus TaxID=83462 RepID=UPI0011C39A4F|nr:hypothetical protein [Corallococcus exiguus]NRD49707.1 hypothetical protein [Corallococcus exiguus]
MGNVGPVGNRSVSLPVSNPVAEARPAAPAASTAPAGPTRTPQQVALQRDGFEGPSAPAPVNLTGAGGPAPMGQRERALEVVRQAPAGSVGAAIRPLLSGAMQGMGAVGYAAGAAPSAAALAVEGMGQSQMAPALLQQMQQQARAGQAAGREAAAGQVGDFYEANRELLNRPATASNIWEFSMRETAFFRQQPLGVSMAASLMSGETRAHLITGSALLQAGGALLQRILP